MKRILVALAVVLSACAPGQTPPLTDLVDTKALDAEVKKSLGIAPELPGEAGANVPLIGPMSDADEQALGREIAGRLLAASPLVPNEALQLYVNRVGRYVAAQSLRPSLNWTFGVIQSDDINAFAAPGGYIFVTAGLYRLLENEAELAGVLAHEIAHVNERHHVKLLQQARLLQLGQSALLGKAKSDTVKNLAGSGLELYARSLDKNAEFACDRLAITYAAKSGYDPFAYIAVLDRIGASEDADQLALLYKTHPHPAERLEVLEKLMGNRWDALGGAGVPQRWVGLD
ncbi:MAG TPA: M48 family metalloprotease [Desulfuromonadales bacterium]|nr:M48 family metalloprotease [Desulfuromonadales bacterium]